MTHEWQGRDKSEWPDGPWKTEPDKIQWVDEATNLDCLMVRNHGGAWCGYVGVTEGHPFFEKDYDSVNVEIHGGLTFADTCTEITPERWEKWRESLTHREQEARQYPRGDAARDLKETGHLRADYEAWSQWAQSRFICHTPEPGRPAHVWWLGFDCSHLGDRSPGFEHISRSIGITRDRDETYRDRSYVENEVRSLARQLAAAAL